MRTHMKKIIFVIFGCISASLLIYFFGIQIANLYVNRSPTITFDARLLLFDGEMIWLNFLTFLVTASCFDILYVTYFSRKQRDKKKAKRRLTKDEKDSYSRLETKREAKKDLLRLDFNTHLKSTWLDRIESFVEQAVKAWNLVFGKLSDRLLFKERKKWVIDGNTTKKRGGLPIISKKRRLYVDASDSHTLWIGTTRSGKSYSQVLPLIESLRMCGESIVVNDPKGELYDYTGWKFKEDGYDVRVLNFIDPIRGDGWNPLELSFNEYERAKKEYEVKHKEWELKAKSIKDKDMLITHLKNEPELDISYALELVRDVCSSLTYSSDSKEAYWNDSARDMGYGAGAFILEEGKREHMNFTSIMNLIDQGEHKVKVGNETNNLLKAYMNKYRDQDDESYKILSGFIDSEGGNRASLLNVFRNKFSIMTMNEQLRRMTSTSTFDIKDIGKKKTALFLIVHDEKPTYYPLVTLFVKQMYEQMIKITRDEENPRLPIPVNIILDEMGNGAPMPNLQNMLTAAASRGVRLYMAIQDIEQLNKLYGTSIAEVVKSNSMNIVYILSGSEKTRKTISEMCGNRLVWNQDKGCYEKDPLISVDKLKSLKLGEMVFIRQRHKNAFLTKIRPYNKYRFYSNKRSGKIEEQKKPNVKYFNLVEAYQDGGR